MTTETVTVMFTDLVDSTALLSEVGAQAAEALRREHFALLRAATESAGGREVKNLGDGLMVVFASAADAVSAAVAVQHAFDQRNRRAERRLLVRVGVSLGDADVEEGDYFGRPVVEAARLCAKAGGGEILIAEVVRLLAGSRGGFTFEPVGELELKGFDDPVVGWQVAWSPLVEGDDWPLPTRLASSVTSNFVGRIPEREQLATAWKEVTNEGGRRVVLLSGEPGIGKTTLSASFASEVHGRGGGVVYGRCDEDFSLPYQPWVELLGQLVEHLPEPTLAAHVEHRGGSLVRLVPDLARRVAVDAPVASDPETERFELFGSVADLLARASDEQPLLVVLDDLHWVDRPSVQLLRHVVLADQPMRVAVLGTFRDSEVSTGHPLAELLAALHRETGVQRISLLGLTDADLLELLEQVAGHEMPENGIGLRDAVLAETAGNPFFIGEILRHLAETGVIYQQDDGRWISDLDLRAAGLPVSVKEVVGRRLATLGEDTERVLALAAVIGRDFDVPTLAAIAHLDEDAIVDLCDAAVFAAILRTTDDPERYTFAHALIEHTLYDGLSPARRARAHRAVGEQLELRWASDPGDRAGELAHHWAAAVQPSDAAKAVHYSAMAGQQALDQLAPDEALRWFGEALELLDRSPEDLRQRAVLLLGLGDAQRQCGLAAHRETLLEAARLADRIDDVETLVRAALANNRGFQSVIGGVDEERVAVIDMALARVRDPASPERARLLGLSCTERIYVTDLDARLALADEAIATARRSGDALALMEALQYSNGGIGCAHTLAVRRVRTAELCEIVDALGNPVKRAQVHLGTFGLALEVGDRDDMLRHLAIGRECADRVPHAWVKWNAAFTQVLEAILDGDLAEAERRAEAAFELATETGQPDPMGIYAGQLANIRNHQGRYLELLPLIEEVVADSPGLPVYRAVLAEVCERAGDTERASTLLEDARADDFRLPLDGTWTTGLVGWANVAVRVGNRAAAEVLHEQLAPFHDQVINTGITVLPTVAHHLGTLDHLLGRHDDADRWFDEAMTIHQRLESPLLTAYTHAAWAALLVDVGERARAEQMAIDALTAAVAGGFGYIEADARAVLARLG